MVNLGLKILTGNARKKQFMSFKSMLFWSSIMKSPTPQAWNLNHPFILFVHAVYSPHLLLRSLLSHQIHCCYTSVLVFKSPLFYLMVAPKYNGSDVGNSDMLLLYLVYKLNLIIGMYTHRENIYLGYTQRPGHWRSWNTYCMDKGRTTVYRRGVQYND